MTLIYLVSVEPIICVLRVMGSPGLGAMFDAANAFKVWQIRKCLNETIVEGNRLEPKKHGRVCHLQVSPFIQP